jgi:hypothetical protein
MLTPAHKLVSLAHVSNVLGSVLDVERAWLWPMASVQDPDRRVPGGAAPAGRCGRAGRAISTSFPRISSMAPPASARSGRVRRHPRRDAPWQGGGSMIDRVTFEKTTWAPPPPVSRRAPRPSSRPSALPPPSIMSEHRAGPPSTRMRPHWSKPCAASSRR